jgi:zinc transport system substrate-binding protein
MKKILLFLVIAVLFTSCNSKKNKNSGNAITVSILPEKTFVEKIAGTDFKVNVLIPPGSSPAAYTLLPSQLKEIANSSVWFRIGYIGFEYSWKDKIAQANTNMKVVDLSEGLDLIAESKQQHGNHFHFEGVNPHIWLSPKLVKQIAQKILDELILLKPEKSDEYKANYSKFAKEIEQLDSKIENKMKEYAGRKIIVFHPSLSYYARDYGIEQYSLEVGGKQTTPQLMAKIVDLAKKENIKVIYIQSEFDREHARVFAEEIDGEIIQVSPLAANWADNLIEMTNLFIENF